MARYHGPRIRILRRLGCELPGLTTKTAARRPLPPGHAAAISRRAPKLEEYGLRLREKQKLRFHYQITETQLRLFYGEAQRRPGDTGRNLIELLESRLDNLVWRAGFTRTIPAAKQLIAHGHVCIDQRRVRTSSQRVKAGAVISLRPNCLKREDIRISINNPVIEVPSGLKLDLDKLALTIENLPSRDQCPIDVDIQKVIEFYSR